MLAVASGLIVLTDARGGMHVCTSSSAVAKCLPDTGQSENFQSLEGEASPQGEKSNINREHLIFTSLCIKQLDSGIVFEQNKQ